MKTIQEEVQLKPAKFNSGRIRPKIIKWHGVDMVRNHSFLAAVKEIVQWSTEQDVTRIGIIGDMHTGKTTMAQAIGHAFHELMYKQFKIPFAVRIFYEEHLRDFQETLKSLSPTNYILIFDDVSFLEAKSSRQEISAIKQAVTKIRHLEGGQDVKIVLIYNYHYNLGFDKYLRQADFRFFTSIGSSELENMEKIVKSKNMAKVYKFINMRRKAIIKKYWTVQLSKKEPFAYRWRNPFIPALYYNGESLRNIISPTRQFMTNSCTICAMAEGVRHSDISIEDLCKEGEKKFGERVFPAALKLKMFENGMNVYAPAMTRAKRWIDIQLTKKIVTLEQFMIHYGLEITKTRLAKAASNVIDGDELKKRDDTNKKNKYKTILQ